MTATCMHSSTRCEVLGRVECLHKQKHWTDSEAHCFTACGYTYARSAARDAPSPQQNTICNATNTCALDDSQVAVLTNHQNGRDTHIRQILLFGPSAQAGSVISISGAGQKLETLESSMFASLR